MDGGFREFDVILISHNQVTDPGGGPGVTGPLLPAPPYYEYIIVNSTT